MTVRGSVTDGNGLPVSGARVIIAAIDNGDAVVMTQTDSRGAFALRNVPAGRYRLWTQTADGLAVVDSDPEAPRTSTEVVVEEGTNIDGVILVSRIRGRFSRRFSKVSQEVSQLV
jgi:hypothetical protein